MNINALTSLLHELTNSNVSRVSPTPKAENSTGSRDTLALGKKALEALNSTQLNKQATRSENKRTAEPVVIQQPAFTPLPLRSELFPNARFFAKLGEKKASVQNAVNETATEMFIHIDLENMGSIWITLSLNNNAQLSVKYFTDNEGASKTIRKNFTSIKDDLQEIGFQNVFLTSQAHIALNNLTNELLPKFEAYLLNQKV